MSDALRTVSPQELALFLERIGRSLAERPLEMGAEEHRERVAALLREVGGASFYELLEVGPTSSPEKIHQGYEGTARTVHPSHAPSLGLAGMEDVLAVLFERATAAYVTLSHPGRRRDYDREIGPVGWADAGRRPSHPEENRDRARTHFNRATEYVAKEEFHFAIELLREAVRLDPQAKYYALLGDLQEKNVNWLRHAVDSYMRALELGGPDPRIEEALARVYRRMEGGGGHEARRTGERARPAVAAAGPGGAPGAGTRGGSRGAHADAGADGEDDLVIDAGDAVEPDPDDSEAGRWMSPRF